MNPSKTNRLIKIQGYSTRFRPLGSGNCTKNMISPPLKNIFENHNWIILNYCKVKALNKRPSGFAGIVGLKRTFSPSSSFLDIAKT